MKQFFTLRSETGFLLHQRKKQSHTETHTDVEIDREKNNFHFNNV